MSAADYRRERARLLRAAEWNGWASRLTANTPDARVSAARQHRRNQAQLAALRRAYLAGRSSVEAA